MLCVMPVGVSSSWVSKEEEARSLTDSQVVEVIRLDVFISGTGGLWWK